MMIIWGSFQYKIEVTIEKFGKCDLQMALNKIANLAWLALQQGNNDKKEQQTIKDEILI